MITRFLQLREKNNPFYHIDRGVLLENTPLVKFIQNFIRHLSGMFSISSLVSILMTSFLAFHGCLCKESVKMASDRFVYIRKGKLHGGLKIWILFSHVKNNILPLENKIRIFMLPFNILYV